MGSDQLHDDPARTAMPATRMEARNINGADAQAAYYLGVKAGREEAAQHPDAFVVVPEPASTPEQRADLARLLGRVRGIAAVLPCGDVTAEVARLTAQVKRLAESEHVATQTGETMAQHYRRQRDAARAEIARLTSAQGEALCSCGSGKARSVCDGRPAAVESPAEVSGVRAFVTASAGEHGWPESPAPALTEEEAHRWVDKIQRDCEVRNVTTYAATVRALVLASYRKFPAEVRTEARRASTGETRASYRGRIAEEEAAHGGLHAPSGAAEMPATTGEAAPDLLAEHVAASCDRATDDERMRLATQAVVDATGMDADEAGEVARAVVDALFNDAPNSVDPRRMPPDSEGPAKENTFGAALARMHKPAAAERLCVAVLVTDAQDRVALIESAKPGRGWELPGGGVTEGEEPRAAAVREVAEEMGLQLAEEAMEYVLRLDGTPKPGATYTSRILVYRARADGELRAGSDAKGAQWLTAADVLFLDDFDSLSDLASRDVLLAWAREMAGAAPQPPSVIGDVARRTIDKLPHGGGQ